MSKPVVTVVVPTVDGREEYLERCLRGYRERTESAEVEFLVYENRPTCGMVWQEGADEAVRLHGRSGFLHFTADDIVPGEGWFLPLAEAVDRNFVPVAAVVNCDASVLEDEFPKAGNPITANTCFFEGHPPADPFAEYPDWSLASKHRPIETAYPSVPFCSLRQWESIGPMIAAHYGTDKWFGRRARLAGFEPIVRHGALFYHYSAQPGRVPAADDWFHIDRLTFELNIAYPEYASGTLPPDQLHPLHYTDEGRELARRWYELNVPEPAEGYYWKQGA